MPRRTDLHLVPDPEPAALTRIHAGIHCVATDDATDVEGMSAMDRRAVETFLETLARIALAVAQRGTLDGGADR